MSEAYFPLPQRGLADFHVNLWNRFIPIGLLLSRFASRHIGSRSLSIALADLSAVPDYGCSSVKEIQSTSGNRIPFMNRFAAIPFETSV